MKILSVGALLGILVLASIGCATVINLIDSNNDGIIENQAREVATETKGYYDLKIQAEGNEANANPGGTGNANILVLVTYDGKPVDVLTETEFTLKTILAPPGYCAVDVQNFNNYGNGGYTFQVVPISGCAWGAGEYDIQLSSSYGGQAIASIEVT